MIVRAAGLGLFLVTLLLIETVVGPELAVWGVHPNLVALSVLAVGMSGGAAAGLRYGFVAGLAIDLTAGPEAIVGISALLLLLTGYGAGLLRPFIAASQLPGQVIVAGAGVTMIVVLEELLGMLLGQEASPPLAMLVIALGAGLYAAVLAPLVCLLAARLERLTPRVD